MAEKRFISKQTEEQMTEDLKMFRKGRILHLEASLAATALPLQEEMKKTRPKQSPPFPFFSLFVLGASLPSHVTGTSEGVG